MYLLLLLLRDEKYMPPIKCVIKCLNILTALIRCPLYVGGVTAVFVWLLRGRKRPRKEQQLQEEDDEDLTAAATPKRRVIKLNSIKELRAEITENTHKGKQNVSSSFSTRNANNTPVCLFVFFSHTYKFPRKMTLLQATTDDNWLMTSSKQLILLLCSCIHLYQSYIFCSCVNSPTQIKWSFFFFFFLTWWQFFLKYPHIFSRSSRNAAEPLVCGLCQPPVDADPTSHQTVFAQHH